MIPIIGVRMAFLLCLSSAVAAVSVETTPRPAVHVAYFVPTDREPIEGYVERLDRVLSHVRSFYAAGMDEHGFGPLTFDLDRDGNGALRVYLVRAEGPMAAYGRDSAGAVGREVRAALAEAGLDPKRLHVVIFQVLLDWRDGKAVEVGPYVGGGNALAGTAWVYDDERLDPRQLASKEPGGFYNRPCSIGEFNSHYIGGVAHEMGHSFGLPHDREQPAQRRGALSLMGAGNHTYGRELRGEGRGTFLSPASAMALAGHPLFTGVAGDPDAASRCEVETLSFDYADGKLTVTGRVEADPSVYGVVAYLDPVEPPSDYDAVGWTCPAGEDGSFAVGVDEIPPGQSQLRLRFCQRDGRWTYRRFAFSADEQGTPDLSVLWQSEILSRAVRAYQQRNRHDLHSLGHEGAERCPDDANLAARLAHLTWLLDPPAPLDLGALGADTTEVSLSALRFEREEVGWGKPLRDQVLFESDGCLLSLGGQFFAKGLYAHAPSVHEVATAGGWGALKTGYGLQDGRGGSVVFVIRGDGEELFRSPVIEDHERHDIRVDLDGVQRLELVVENGGDDNRSDWGIWVEPVLKR